MVAHAQALASSRPSTAQTTKARQTPASISSVALHESMFTFPSHSQLFVKSLQQHRIEIVVRCRMSHLSCDGLVAELQHQSIGPNEQLRHARRLRPLAQQLLCVSPHAIWSHVGWLWHWAFGGLEDNHEACECARNGDNVSGHGGDLLEAGGGGHDQTMSGARTGVKNFMYKSVSCHGPPTM